MENAVVIQEDEEGIIHIKCPDDIIFPDGVPGKIQKLIEEEVLYLTAFDNSKIE